MEKKITYQEALTKMAGICSVSEKCEKEVRAKLTQWELTAEEIEKVIDRLEKEKFIDERRYASFFAKDKHRFAKWGKAKIEYALKLKGISSSVIKDALAEIDSHDYTGQVRTLLESKYSSIKYKDMRDAKAKLYRFGISRGFESEIVYRIIDEILKKK
jgi:regulatory protein